MKVTMCWRAFLPGVAMGLGCGAAGTQTTKPKFDVSQAQAARG